MYHPLLKTFVYIVEMESFSKETQKMYITLTSVMKQINALEEHLHIKLVNRTHRGIKVTEQGQKIYDEDKILIENSDNYLNKIQEKTSSMIHIDLCHSIPTLSQRYKLRVVPYEDDYDKIMEVYQSLGTKFDFLIGAFNSNPILSFASCKQLGTYNVCVALPRSHPLAKKEKLSITDLYNEKLLCVSSGDCLNLDDFRKDMQTFYPQIILEDVGYFYDLDTFNRCEEEGCLLLTLDAWDNIHPSLITLPVEWDYQMPYGLLYKKNPPKQVKDCLRELINMSNRTKLQLEDAFKELLLEKTFHKITIKDLTDKCHISRIAFYYHFQDLYDLIEWILIEDARKALNEKKNYAHCKEGLSNIFEAVYINKPFILNVYHDISRDKIEKI